MSRLASLGWVGSVALGLGALSVYSATPGPTGIAPLTLPFELRGAEYGATHTLVMVAHPDCPCTRASISELARLLADHGAQLDVVVLFVGYRGTEETMVRGPLWLAAQRITGVRVAADPEGTLAQRLGAATSGSTLLFDTHGDLRFHGGLTPTRAHEGNSIGRERIVSLLTQDHADRESSLVYGCPLTEDEQ